MVALSRDKGNGFEFKAFFRVNPMFHAKLYISRAGESVSFLSGSFNLAGKALDSNTGLGNLEHGLYVKGAITEDVCKQALCRFDDFWKKAVCPSDDQVKRYRDSYADSRGKLSNLEAWVAARENSDINYWLFECNILEHNYSFGHLLLEKDCIAEWGEEITTGPCRKIIPDNRIKLGDQMLFLHTQSGSKKKVRDVCPGGQLPAVGAIVGTARVIAGTHASEKKPGQLAVSIQAVSELSNPVSLQDIRQNPGLKSMMLARNPQLSIQKVRPEEWSEILRMANGEKNQ